MRYFYFCLILLLSSCIEIIEDLKLNTDGSGTFKYVINLSPSKTKVTSILALDSLYGEKVPKENEIRQKILMFKETLKSQEGITNVLITEDYTNYIFKFQCDFKSVEKLETGLKTSIKKLYVNNEYDYDWISFKDNVLKRKTPIFYIDDIRKFGDIDKLKNGTYTSINRFASKIDTFENKNSLRSKTNMALMIKTTPDLLLKDQTILNNKIILKK
jgi:hypothetical protein